MGLVASGAVAMTGGCSYDHDRDHYGRRDRVIEERRVEPAGYRYDRDDHDGWRRDLNGRDRY
jgi:hypothetical protein